MSVTETRLITIVQAVEIVGLSRSKLYELPASRELASVRIGRARRIDLADLSASSRVTGCRSAQTSATSRTWRATTRRLSDEDPDRYPGCPASRHPTDDPDSRHG
jgi:excisionase family DNA binding protein